MGTAHAEAWPKVLERLGARYASDPMAEAFVETREGSLAGR
jgi:hypothetical protein